MGSSTSTIETHEGGTDGWVNPKFARGLDSPRYEVLEKTDDYEVRLYDASNWVSTSSDGTAYPSAGYKNFMKLFRYIGGSNENDQKIAMTCPVINRITPDEDNKSCEDKYTMSFFVAPSQSPAPSPKEEKVFLSSQPKQKVYVKSFGGFAKKHHYLKVAEELRQKLPSSTEYHTDFWYTAGYDSPFQFFNRHNEVWLIGK